MSIQRVSAAARLRTALPWIVLAGALVAATEPAWSLALLGSNPSLDDLLSVRCFASQ